MRCICASRCPQAYALQDIRSAHLITTTMEIGWVPAVTVLRKFLPSQGLGV